MRRVRQVFDRVAWKRRVGYLIGLLLISLWLSPGLPARDQESLLVPYRAGTLPLDPDDPRWNTVPSLRVSLMGQIVTTPIHAQPAVTSVVVHSLHNGEAIAWRVEWSDATRNGTRSLDAFPDGVAIQVPYDPVAEPSITMGEAGKRVLVLHWTADRQTDADLGYVELPRLYPNWVWGWYPHARPPYRYPEDWEHTLAMNYLGGEHRVAPYRSGPVREGMAEGYGSLTWKRRALALGQGRYAEGRWAVVIARPFKIVGTSNPRWGPGATSVMSVAVWDGSAGEVGARKAVHYHWIPLQIEAAPK